MLLFATAPFALCQEAAIRSRNPVWENAGSIVAPGGFLEVSAIAPPTRSLATDSTMELTDSSGRLFNLPLRIPPAFAGLWAVIPKDAALGNAVGVVIERGVRSANFSLRIESVVPGLFSVDYRGYGPGLALNYVDAIPTRNALTTAAVPDRYVALFASGLNDAKTADVTVDLVGQSVPATYAGPQGTPGLDQINFLMPKDAYLGCYVPVAIRVRGVRSNEVTLSINTDTNACAHPLGFSYSELRALDRGENVPFAYVGIDRGSSFGADTGEAAYLTFSSTGAASMWRFAGSQVPASVYFSCSAPLIRGVLPGGFLPGPQPGDFTLLSGPNGKQLEMPRPYLAAVPVNQTPVFFSPGIWQFSAPTGPSFFTFSQTFSLPSDINSINIAPNATVSRDRDLEITWDPSGFNPGDVVTVSMFGAGPNNIECRTQAWTGRITFPKPVPTLAEQFIGLRVAPHLAARPQFVIPRSDGYPVRAVLNYRFGYTFPVKVE